MFVCQLEDKADFNPFATPEVAACDEDWYLATGRQADQQEKALLKWLLAGFPQARTILEAGCGTGHFTRWFGELGQQAFGLDRSRPMLDEAARINNLLLLQGDVQALPFRSKSFDLAVLITTLEFLPDPILALAEAMRVARHELILGVLNVDSRLGREYLRAGELVWRAARLCTTTRDEMGKVERKNSE